MISARPPAGPPQERPAARSPRRRWPWILATLALLLALDLGRAPQRQVSAAVLLGAIDLYQLTLSPRMSGFGVRCRFTPSCSHYAEGAIRARGALVGSGLAMWRIVRCGPWTPLETEDPPPAP